MQTFKSLCTETIRLFLKRGFLYLKLHYLSVQFIKLCRKRIQLRLDKRTRLIHKVDSLIRQKSVGNISVGKRSRCNKRTVRYLYAVEYFITLLKSPKDRYGILNGRLVHLHRLKSSLKCSILFDIFSVFVKCCRTYAVKLSSCKHGLEHISGIHCAVCLARTDYKMQLIDKQNYPALALANLFKNSFKSFLKLTSVFGSCDKGAHIQREYRFVFKSFRHIAFNNTLCKSLNYCRLADTWFTDKYGIVFRFPRQNTNHISNLRIPAYNGIQLMISCTLHKVCAVFIKRVVCILRIIARNSLIAPYGTERL